MKKTVLKFFVYLALGCFSFLSVKAQTTLTVTNTLDDNSSGSLRSVVAGAATGDTIRFAPSLISGGSATITLTQGAISFSTDSLVFVGLYNATDTLYISGNHASGVISATAGNLLTIDSMVIINGNHAGGYGGGIFANNNATVTNSTISGNTASYGGSIFANNNATVTNSTISGNTGYYGGGIYTSHNITVTNSTISGNSASNWGGGIETYFGNATVTNSTISGNAASKGGGIWTFGYVTVANSTITGNISTYPEGGGVFYYSINVKSSIIANNTGGDLFNDGDGYSFPSSDINSGGGTDGGYNIFTDVPDGAVGTDQTGVTADQLKLGLLQNNGGTTFTMLPGSGSVAIGKGNPSDNSADQRGYNIPSGSGRDVGAVTTAAYTLIVTNTRDDNSAGSLRTVVAGAATGDTIRFAPSLISGGSATITLIQGAISFSTDSLVFVGLYNATDTLYVSGNHASGVISATAGNLLTIDSMVIINGNNAGGTGGGIYANSNLNVTNSTISGNTSGAFGGGIAGNNNVTVTNSTISGNTSSNNGGGGIAGTDVTVTNSTISGNTAGNNGGGGIYANNVTVTNSTISGNEGIHGGGIGATNNVTVTNSTISGNIGRRDGGGINAYNVTVTNSTFSGNTGDYYGGGIYSWGYTTVTNSTISGNFASYGGGIGYSSSINVTSSIIANNTAYNTGGNGDLYDQNSGTSDITIDGGYNIFTDAPGGSVSTDQTRVTTALNLGPLQNNGGTTFTMLPGAGSVAIGKGNPSDNSADQRGYVIPSGVTRDVGAVTAAATAPIIWTGVISSAWENAANWNTDVVPGAADGVSIPSGVSNFPVISSTPSINSITINSGASLTVNGALQIAGVLYNYGSLYAAAGTIDLNGTSNQLVHGGNGTVGSLEIDNSVGATLSDTLNVINNVSFGGSISNATLVSNGYLVLKSSDASTASVSALSNGNAITGNVTVERYIPANSKRAWRLLSVPTQGGQSINAAWQEGQTGGSNNVPRYGTIITAGSSDGNWASDGYDYQQLNSSILTYNSGGNSFLTVPSTYDPIATTSGYYLYIRGDRSIIPSVSTIGATATTLRTMGSLYEGTQAPVVTASGSYGLIGNIYASAIDITGLTIGAGISNTYYVWDPKLLLSGSLGGYQTFSAANSWKPLPGAGSYDANTPNTRVESGEAFFVYATGGSDGDRSVTFTESSKVSGSALVFRPVGNASAQLQTNLYEVAGSTNSLADGNMAVFNSSYANAIDVDDALKLPNATENFGILLDGKQLELDASQPITGADTIHFVMSNMNKQQYKLQFIPTNFNTSGLTAFLKDSYLGTSASLSLNTTDTISFAVDANAGSSVANRFMIVFSVPLPLPVNFTNITASPKTGGSVMVDWQVAQESGIASYKVERSTDGVNFETVGTVAANGNTSNAISYSYDDTGAESLSGTVNYRVESVDISGNDLYSQTVAVSLGSGIASSITVYPNPIGNGQLNLKFNNEPGGEYAVRLMNVIGQSVYSEEINHSVGATEETVSLPSSIVAGVYQVEVTDASSNKHIALKVIITD